MTDREKDICRRANEKYPSHLLSVFRMISEELGISIDEARLTFCHYIATRKKPKRGYK